MEERPQQTPGIEQEMQIRPDYGLESYRGYGRLKDKAAIITGGDSGIGRAVALAFAREGADVLIAYLNEEQDAEETVKVVRDAGREGIGVPGDVGQEQHCKALVDRAMREFGHLDILVNNAAFQMSHKGIEDLPSEEWDYTFRTNIYAMYYLCRAAIPVMRQGSAIVNTASIQAYQPSPSLLAYATTKGAIVTFTKALAQDAIKKGIRVNAVAPGPVWTPLIVSTMPPEHIKEFGKTSPIGRPAQPVELAPSYVFLASNESSYITGEVVGVTGGKPLD
ncbi:MAG: short-chain dehydrogenase/reductase [Chloroflexi bacterium]|nr:short-chain dehydrogenase/reductase [Chloroflexota bacterium]